MIKKMCCSRFSLHKFIHLKCFWTQFKNLHLRGPCSLRRCISRPYCTKTAQMYMFAHWTKKCSSPQDFNWTTPDFESSATYICHVHNTYFSSIHYEMIPIYLLTYLRVERGPFIYFNAMHKWQLCKKRCVHTMGQSKNINPTSCSRRYWMTPSLNWRVEGHLNPGLFNPKI